MIKAMIKALRTIRFDDTDTRVFAHAADAGEWAVSGAFAFPGDTPLTGKTKQAFANGFLGLTSFGYSTFATVGEMTASELATVEQALAQYLVDTYGAPSAAAALAAAREEIAFAADLCQDVPINTVFTVRRVQTEISGKHDMKEEFRTIKPPNGEPAHARVWTIERDDTDGA
jgi:Family of unknown function (DUF6505)